MFVDKLNQKIDSLFYGSRARNVFKSVLNIIEEQSKSNQLTEEDCQSIVKGMLDENNKLLKRLEKEDPRYSQCKKATLVLESLLPRYWSHQDVFNWLKDEKINVNGFTNVSEALGFCEKKLSGELVKPEVVEEVINEMRSSG